MSISTTGYVSSLSPEYALLGFLAQKPAHGYELHQRTQAELGQVWHISLSQTYNILNRLESQGWIAGEVETQKKHPARRIFHLTAAGQERFDVWQQTPTGSSVRAIRVEFITRLYFAHLTSPEMTRLLIDQQDQEISLGLAILRNTLGGVPYDKTFNRLALELRIRQLDSVQTWLAECRRMLVSQASWTTSAPGQG